MKENLKVSIIVPIYNVEAYVEKCLISLINQTYNNIVVYAISDGSPDNSINIAKKLADKDKRIVCIEKENGGYGSVLEYAINIIETKYFMICDPDDWLEEDAVDVLLNTAESNNLDLVIGDKFLIYDNCSQKYKCDSNIDHKLILANKLYENDDVYKLAVLHASPHSKLYKTDLVRKLIFPKKVSYTDLYLYLNILNNSKRAMYINKYLSNYLIERVGNTTTDKSLKSLRAQITVFNSSFKSIKHNPYFMWKLYEQYRYGCIDILSHFDMVNYNEIEDEINCINCLKQYKKEIKKVMKYNSIVKTIYNKIIIEFLFNEKSRRKCIDFIIKVSKRKINEKR